MVEDDSTHHRSSQPSTGATPAPLHVLIVGGGVGGLCLAQGLKKSGISVAVYERDESAQFRSQGYRIGLKEAGAQALRDCLPEDLFNLCLATWTTWFISARPSNGSLRARTARSARTSPMAPQPPEICWSGPTEPIRRSATSWCPMPSLTSCTTPSTARPPSQPTRWRGSLTS